YFENQSKEIVATGGMIDKYIGDKILAVWDDENSAENAVLAASRQQHALCDFNAWTASKQMPAATNRIGIATGYVSVDYGPKSNDIRVLGDHVNLASRLEAIAGEYGAAALMDQNSHGLLLSRKWATRHVDTVRVASKDRPVQLYSLVGERANLSPDDLDFLEQHRIAMEHYAAAKFQDAKVILAKMSQERPSDRVASLFASRCDLMLAHPEYTPWDGVTPYFVS
ncbi:MAG: adenylate/guanylate cyclase domain-containing protein, partial [Betaproteobacteria bacterium]|nr:adenylate/guanylate cyclase domain-containing protein [Betaproteobacteria bacterium]